MNINPFVKLNNKIIMLILFNSYFDRITHQYFLFLSLFISTLQVPFLPGAYGIDEFHKKIEDHLYAHYKARPHWSKNNFLNHKRVQQLYPELEKWKQIYLLFNRDGTFDNEFTRKCGFEDFHPTDDDETVDDHRWRGEHGKCCSCERLHSGGNTRGADVNVECDAQSRIDDTDSGSNLSSNGGSRTVEAVVEDERAELWVKRDSGRHVSPCSCDDSTLRIPMGKSGAIVQQPTRSSLPPLFVERTPLAVDTREVVESAARHGCGAESQRGSDTYPHPLPTVKSTLV